MKRQKIFELAKSGVGQGGLVPLPDAMWERLIADAEVGSQSAMAYLRQRVEYEVNPPEPSQPLNEDGPCTGWGCEALLIY